MSSEYDHLSLYRRNYYPPLVRVSRIVQMYQVREVKEDEGENQYLGDLLTESLYEGAITKWLGQHGYAFYRPYDMGGIPYPKDWGKLIGDYRREEGASAHE